MLSVGLSTNGRKLNDPDFFNNCKTDGIEYIEISVSSEEMETLDFTGIKEKADKAGVTLWSLHLPFMPFLTIDISSSNKAVRNDTVELLCGYIEKGAAIGIKYFIVHPSGEPVFGFQRKNRMKYAKESLKILADKAALYGGVICVEDLPRTCLGRNSTEILELLSADERLRCCFDTNHLLKEDIEAFIKNVGNRIVTTHISDYDKKDEKHWLPGEGVIDWKKLKDTLLETGYDGPWLYEVGFSAPKTMPRSRKLTTADFAGNAREILTDKNISIIK